MKNNNGKQFKMLAKTLYGLEDIIAKELSEIGAQNIQKVNRGVHFEGDNSLMYKANLHLRTALRILKPITTFNAKNDTVLYNEIKKVDWSDYLDLNDTLAVDSVVHSHFFKHSKYVALRTKDAIVDQFRERTRRRPFVDVKNPDLLVNIHIADTQVTVSLDSSGDSLNRRGYRLDASQAPLNEVLAAGMILLSDWDKKSFFIDPMCGSGTILIEAAMMAYNIPPSFLKPKFGFESWNDFEKKTWFEIKQEAKNNIIRDKQTEILGNDKSSGAFQTALRNINRAGLGGKIKLLSKDFFKMKIKEEEGLVIINPPYGKRIEPEDLMGMYQKIGDKLKQDFTGFEAWILSSNDEAVKQIGLRPSKKIVLFNGGLQCKYLKYELYEGSKKQKYREDNDEPEENDV